MTEPKQFKRGRRTYTRMGAFKEIKIETGDPKKPAAAPITLDPPSGPGGEAVYANVAAVHKSGDEVVVDFAFVPPRANRGRVRSRVILNHRHARRLGELLKKAAEE